MWRCERCGTDNFENSQKCSRCGTSKPNQHREIKAGGKTSALYRFLRSEGLPVCITVIACIAVIILTVKNASYNSQFQRTSGETEMVSEKIDGDTQQPADNISAKTEEVQRAASTPNVTPEHIERDNITQTKNEGSETKAKSTPSESTPEPIATLTVRTWDWSLKGNVLTISGTGVMEDFNDNDVPWPAQIESLIIEEGITSVGEKAFQGCHLYDVTLPLSLKKIGTAAFYDCIALSNIFFSGSEDQWRAIDVGEANDSLQYASIHFNSNQHDQISMYPSEKELFNNTYWSVNFGSSIGTQYYGEFRPNHTFTLVNGIGRIINGDFSYFDGRLVLRSDDFQGSVFFNYIANREDIYLTDEEYILLESGGDGFYSIDEHVSTGTSTDYVYNMHMEKFAQVTYEDFLANSN